MASMIGSFEGPEGQEIVKLEDKVAELAFFAKELKQKKDFLESFAYVIVHLSHLTDWLTLIKQQR